jgi:hypothetical protein
MTARDVIHESWRSWYVQDHRRAGPAWLQYLWTFVFSAFIALAFTILGFAAFGGGNGDWRSPSAWWHWYRVNLGVSLTIGYLIHFLFEGARRLIGAERIRCFGGLMRVVFFTGIPIVGVMIGWPLSMWLMGFDTAGWLRLHQPDMLISGGLISVLVTFLLYQFFDIKNRQIDAERRATEAQLKLLQGQIEPHFLFNTLANVVSLMASDTPRAKLMLESFVDYLRSSLGSLRQTGHTLGDELDLIDAYLRVIGIRMDDRLRYRIDVPEALRTTPLPALTLQPLVENAVVHGLEPKLEGGELRVSARVENQRLIVSVQDDGLGLRSAPADERPRHGSGTACQNIRERLLQSHGSQAELRIESVAPHGVHASLVLPLEDTTR